MKDKLGFDIPAHIEALWKEANAIGHELTREVHRIKLLVEKAIARRDLAFREINQGTARELENAWRALCLIIPYAVCPICEADERRYSCVACRTRGFMSKFRYDRCIPRDVKDARLVRLAS